MPTALSVLANDWQCFKAFENPITYCPDFRDPNKEEIKSISKHKGIIFVKCQRMPNGNNFKLCTILKAKNLRVPPSLPVLIVWCSILRSRDVPKVECLIRKGMDKGSAVRLIDIDFRF